MHPLFNKRIEIPGVWVSAFLFPFKLLAIGGALLLFIWYLLLPPNHTKPWSGIDMVWYNASNDFFVMACSVSLLYFLVFGVLLIGGVVQQFKCSQRAAIWSFAFAIFALIVGIVLACVSPPNGYIEIFRRAA
jgi:hypothetical protein